MKYLLLPQHTRTSRDPYPRRNPDQILFHRVRVQPFVRHWLSSAYAAVDRLFLQERQNSDS